MRVLLLDTAFAAAPVYNYLLHAGHEVWVVGNRPNDLLAKKAGPNWIDLDYSRVEEVEKLTVQHGIDYVVPGCTDISIETCLQLKINSHLLDTPEINHTLSNKREFRQLCAELALPAPAVVPEGDFPIPGRFICKPVDSFSGRGMTVFEGSDRDALHAALYTARKASPTSSALIESFAAGDLYSCSAFVEDQRLTSVFYVREGSSANPFAVDTSYVAYGLPEKCTGLLEKSLGKICSRLQLKDGLLHTQFILVKEAPIIIEVCRRCPGDLYCLLIEITTGFQYAAKYASYFIADKHEARATERNHILRHTVASIEDAIFGGLRLRESKGMRAYFPTQAMGQEMFAGQATRAGILFCEYASYQELINDYSLFVSRGVYNIS